MVLNIQSPPWEFHSVEEGDATRELVKTIANMGNVKGWPFFAFYSEHIVNPEEIDDQEESEPDSAYHEMRVSIDPPSGLSALHWFCYGDPGSPYISQSETAPYDVHIVYDGSTGEAFPTNALVPIEVAKKALMELSQDGKRPECVEWQPFDKV